MSENTTTLPATGDENSVPDEVSEETAADVVIRHTRAEGTTVEISTTDRAQADAIREILRRKRYGSRGGMPFKDRTRTLGAWILYHSRDQRADTWTIDLVSRFLREELGVKVFRAVDDTARRSFAEAEAEKYERATERAERHETYAAGAANRRDARWQASHAISEHMTGEPIKVGHHSERAHRRAIERMDGHMRKSIEEADKARYHADRAAAAAAYETFRKDPWRTLRRIEGLEKDLRDNAKWAAGQSACGSTRSTTPEGLAQLAIEREEIEEKLAYWREVVADAERRGLKVWRPEDFAKGDFCNTGGTWREVLRVNKKTLTVASVFPRVGVPVVRAADMADKRDGRTFPYTSVAGWAAPADIARMEAAETEPEEGLRACPHCGTYVTKGAPVYSPARGRCTRCGHASPQNFKPKPAPAAGDAPQDGPGTPQEPQEEPGCTACGRDIQPGRAEDERTAACSPSHWVYCTRTAQTGTAAEESERGRCGAGSRPCTHAVICDPGMTVEAPRAGEVHTDARRIMWASKTTAATVTTVERHRHGCRMPLKQHNTLCDWVTVTVREQGVVTSQTCETYWDVEGELPQAGAAFARVRGELSRGGVFREWTDGTEHDVPGLTSERRKRHEDAAAAQAPQACPLCRSGRWDAVARLCANCHHHPVKALTVWPLSCTQAPRPAVPVWADGPALVFIVSREGGPSVQRALWRVTRREAMAICSDRQTSGTAFALHWSENPGTEDEDWKWTADDGRFASLLDGLGITAHRDWPEGIEDAFPKACPRCFDRDSFDGERCTACEADRAEEAQAAAVLAEPGAAPVTLQAPKEAVELAQAAAATFRWVVATSVVDGVCVVRGEPNKHGQEAAAEWAHTDGEGWRFVRAHGHGPRVAWREVSTYAEARALFVDFEELNAPQPVMQPLVPEDVPAPRESREGAGDGLDAFEAAWAELSAAWDRVTA